MGSGLLLVLGATDAAACPGVCRKADSYQSDIADAIIKGWGNCES
jgi:hypothetical protein